jgi:hypothetical protein
MAKSPQAKRLIPEEHLEDKEADVKKDDKPDQGVGDDDCHSTSG